MVGDEARADAPWTGRRCCCWMTRETPQLAFVRRSTGVRGRGLRRRSSLVASVTGDAGAPTRRRSRSRLLGGARVRTATSPITVLDDTARRRTISSSAPRCRGVWPLAPPSRDRSPPIPPVPPGPSSSPRWNSGRASDRERGSSLDRPRPGRRTVLVARVRARSRAPAESSSAESHRPSPKSTPRGGRRAVPGSAACGRLQRRRRPRPRRRPRSVVIRNAPLLFDATPMPTRYWLVGKREREAVGRLESGGGVRRAAAAV